MTVINGWDNFYVILGSSAGALTGLMFVVITLIAGTSSRGSTDDVNAYGTPNVVHFCAVLFFCALLSAPWESLQPVGVLLILSGLAGVGYATVVVRRMMRRARLSDSYSPVLEDWVWFGVLPLGAYITIMIAALVFLGNPALALYIIAAALVLLVAIGIHNAWDTVTWTALVHGTSRDEDAGGKESDKNKSPV